MSSTQRTGLLLVVLFSVLVGGAWQAADKQAAPKWEYKEIYRDNTAPGDKSQDNANKLGAEGWELVAVDNPSASPTRLWFKRPKQ